MKRFGLIGHPIGHSLSPRLFTAAYGGRYRYELIEGADFEASWERFLSGYDGINVTAPFKEPACAKASWRSPECEAIGAANLIIKEGSVLKAYNSDISAVRICLEKALEGKMEEGGSPLKILVAGCGGAGKAAAAAVLMTGERLVIANRSADKAEAFAERLASHASALSCMAGTGSPEIRAVGLDSIAAEAAGCDAMVYTLPAPLPDLDKVLSSMKRGAVIIEANYRNPSITRKNAAEHGLRLVEGLEWLTAQAAAGYSLFTGEEPDTAAIALAADS